MKHFRNEHVGKRAFVLGNGPSLSKTPLEYLGDEISFSSNGIDLIFNRTNWRPTVYSCIDSVVMIDRLEEIRSMISELPNTHFFFPKDLFEDSVPQKSIDVKRLFRPSSNTTFFNSVPYQLTDNAFTAFSPDLEDYLVHSTTVSITLIQLAALMGCNPIYLIGCDTDYTIPTNAIELNPEADRIDKLLTLDADNDPNHFDPAYFGKGKKWHTPNPHLMIQQYEKVKEACDHRGFQIYNATNGGKLEVFPRVDYTSLF